MRTQWSKKKKYEIIQLIFKMGDCTEEIKFSCNYCNEQPQVNKMRKDCGENSDNTALDAMRQSWQDEQ